LATLGTFSKTPTASHGLAEEDGRHNGKSIVCRLVDITNNWQVTADHEKEFYVE
jgi:hypothetical protein